MKKMRSLILPLVVLLGIFWFVSFQKEVAKDSSCVRIPVSFFPFSDRPTMKIEIEGKNYSVLIDLGFSRPLSLQPRYMEKIQNKEFLESTNFLGVKGNSYRTECIRIPEVKILSAVLKNVIISEDSLGFFIDSNIWPASGIWDRLKDRLESTAIKGRVGWAVFRETSCFFDFPNSVLFLAKDLPALIDGTGCSFDDFIEVPFEVENYGIVLQIGTEFGTKKVMLDTGATHSILRESVVGQNSIEISDDRKSCVVNQLKIGDHVFGNWRFWLLEFSDFFECDGILGVDFFNKYAVCLDFHDKVAYIQPRG